MPLTIRIEQDGETKEYQISGDATLVIKGEAQFNEQSLGITGAAELSLSESAPWVDVGTGGGEVKNQVAETLIMVVTIPELNVRHEPDTDQDQFTSIKEGAEITVSGDTLESIGFIWRQIVAPANLAGKWVAQQKVGGDTAYIQPPDEVKEATSSGASEGTVETKTTDSRLEPPPETPDTEPAALTGRFQLVKKQGPRGEYTALAIDGDSTPKLGVNVREFVHFGIPQWKWTDVNTRANYCQAAKDVGMKWIRFFTPHISYSNLEENLKRIQQTLDVVRDHGLIAVVTLTDSLADVGMYPKEDQDWHDHSIDFGHYNKKYFNDNLFRNHYHPYVKQVVSRFKDHKGVGIWQLMNEPAIYPAPASDTDVEGFARWVDESSKLIYDLDTTHPIAIGMINGSHIRPPHQNQQAFILDFYSKRKYIHVVTCHAYQNMDNGDHNASWDLEEDSQVDVDVAAKTGRAMMWTEFGASRAGNRTMATERFLNRQLLQNRASAALQWGFMVTSNDTGVGDSNFGWSPVPHINAEYNEMKQLYAGYPAKLANL